MSANMLHHKNAGVGPRRALQTPIVGSIVRIREGADYGVHEQFQLREGV